MDMPSQGTPEEQRISDVLQPFVQLEREIQARRGMPHYDAQSLLALLATLLPWVPYLIALSTHSSTADFWMKFSVVAMSLGGAFLLWSLATDLRRFKRKKAYPLLARGLAPLQPTAQELEESLWICQQQGFSTGQFIDLKKLIDQLKGIGYSPPPISKYREN